MSPEHLANNLQGNLALLLLRMKEEVLTRPPEAGEQCQITPDFGGSPVPLDGARPDIRLLY